MDKTKTMFLSKKTRTSLRYANQESLTGRTNSNWMNFLNLSLLFVRFVSWELNILTFFPMKKRKKLMMIHVVLSRTCVMCDVMCDVMCM